MSDALYGMDPGTDEDFGVNPGTMTTRGEVGVLILPLDSLIRVASNPFFPYMLERIEEGIVGRGGKAPAAAATPDGPRATVAGDKAPAVRAAK